jgi:peroxiredoxin
MTHSRHSFALLLGLLLPLVGGSAWAESQPPRTKAFSETPKAQLGTLPEGLGVAVGQKAPEAMVEDSSGKPAKLSELIARGPVLLVFYRGGWCPYCNFQIRELGQAWPEFQKRGITPVALSVDRVQEAAKTKTSWQVPFPVLSDPDLVAHKAFRMVHTTSEQERQALKSFGIDLEGASGRQHHSFAVPGLFLIDKEGTVRWAHAEGDYKVRPKVEQVLAAMDEALAPKAPVR